MFKTIPVTLAVIGFAASALPAQTILAPDTFKVNYYSNANSFASCTVGPCADLTDGTVRITNVGTQIGSKADPSGYLVAGVFVLEPDQQLAECCFFVLSPDALLTLSINNDLTSNPLTPVTLTTGDIKMVGFTPLSSFASHTEVAGLRAWATHLQNDGSLTETEFTDSTLSTGELNQLLNKCKSIETNGSGFGICGGGVGEAVAASFK
jgi:hypothetical protein